MGRRGYGSSRGRHSGGGQDPNFAAGRKRQREMACKDYSNLLKRFLVIYLGCGIGFFVIAVPIYALLPKTPPAAGSNM